MNGIYPLTVFYDGNCSLCAEEIALMRTCNTENRLLFVDCGESDFDERPYVAQGIGRALMLERIHVQTVQQQWFTGVVALEQLYRALDLLTIAQLFGGRFSKPFAMRIYPYFVRYRFIARWLGIGWLFRQLNHFYAKRALKRSQQCANGQCNLPTNRRTS